MRKFLVLRLYGPLCSWGSVAVGERRASDLHPSRSALLGLIAAALGIKRDNSELMAALFAQLATAIQVINGGTLLRDYHTAQVPPARAHRTYATRGLQLKDESASGLNTILSSRDYRLDAVYTAAFWSRGEIKWSEEDLAEAIRQPKFSLYLGRKSCPVAAPLSPQVISAPTLKAAFDTARFPVDFMLGRLFDSHSIRFYWEHLGPEESGMTPDMVMTRRDDPGSRTQWQFHDRFEYQYLATVSEGMAHVFQQDPVAP